MSKACNAASNIMTGRPSMSIRSRHPQNEIRESISRWIESIWREGHDESTLQITDSLNLEAEWNSESECGIEHGCLDIMIVDNERNLLSKVCATSYNSQDHDKVADSLILELMLINL